MSNLWKASLQQASQSGMTTAFGLLKSGKLILRHTSDRGDLIKFLGEWYEKVRLGFSHEVIRLDGTAQSVRNEETPRDRSGRPDIDSQKEAQFFIGNDEAELELSAESRSFVNWGLIRCEKDSKGFRMLQKNGEKHSMIWRMFMAVTMESAFMGKNYQNNCHSITNTRDLTLKTNVRHIYEIGVCARWDLRIGNSWLGKSFMEIFVFDWWRKSHQSSTPEGLRLFGFCVVPWEDFSKILKSN